MNFSIAIGCHALTNFIRLNVAYLTKVFGDSPILLYDSPSEANSDIKSIAAEYGCAYFCERINRGHFSGDIEAAVCAIAFAQHHNCDIALKINQRTVLLSPEIPRLLEREFADPEVKLVTPGVAPESSILEQASKFHSRFPSACDILCFRANAWDAAGVGERYTRQWKESDYKYATYSEVFWGNESKRLGQAHRKVDWLTAHTPGEPFKYLRKIQNRPEDYGRAAMEIGIPVGGFTTVEWDKLKRGNYRPNPRA